MAQPRCVKCNRFIKQGSKTCPHCGATQSEEESTSSTSCPTVDEGNNDENKQTDAPTNIKPNFLDRLPLLLDYLIVFIAFFVLSILFCVIVCLVGTSQVVREAYGTFHYLEGFFPLLVILSAVCALVTLPFFYIRKRELGSVTGESKLVDYFAKAFLAAIVIGIALLFYSCSAASSRYEGTEERWNELSPHEQEVIQQYNEYTDALEEMSNE